MPDRILIVGLDRPELDALRPQIDAAVVAAPAVPRIKLQEGTLLVERAGAAGHFLPVDRVVFHGIFDDDFDFIACLALWGGPCLPSARGMLRCRQRVPCLIDALAATRFRAAPRGFGIDGVEVKVTGTSVAKWGSRHCGEDKERFDGSWACREATLIEPFVQGEAVRLMIIGEQAWQIRLTGEDWRKSIHPADAAFVDLDPELLADARSLQAHFGLELVGIDYMIGTDGRKHLLEVNHIPNVDRFAEVREAYVEYVAEWVKAGR